MFQGLLPATALVLVISAGNDRLGFRNASRHALDRLLEGRVARFPRLANDLRSFVEFRSVETDTAAADCRIRAPPQTQCQLNHFFN